MNFKLDYKLCTCLVCYNLMHFYKIINIFET